ncbi:MFS transporter [Desertihabitans aurantiacus]|uniref:MFS transporter n=1 Tax=Desertihabitans aurantiacus TaxID=2282477 RepID=UPI000DF7AFCD|nr:MFS transporter [Desertihabitans aurantiacus]
MSETGGATVPIDRRRARRAVVAASLGNAMEWFDIIVYAFLAPVMARLFFPEFEGVVGLLIAYGLVGVSYLIRPVGALVIGSYGDRRGRKAALTLTIGLMTLGTAVMAFAPPAAAVGAAAPLLILLSRLIQGFSAGGEFGSATAFMTEHTEDRKAFFASWQVATQGLSMFLAAGWGFVLTTVVSEEALYGWAWRLPFVFGLLIGPIGLWIRAHMDDTPEFEAAEKVRSPLGTVRRHHPHRVLTAAMCVGMATMSVYLITYLPNFASANLGMPGWTGYAGAVVAGLVALVLSPVFGVLADRHGPSRVMLPAAVLGLLAAYPLFWMLVSTRSVALFIVAEIVIGLLMAAYFAPTPALLADLFPTAVRTTGMALAYNIGVTLLGGFANFWIVLLLEGTGLLEAPSFYYVAVALLSVVGLLIARRVFGSR